MRVIGAILLTVCLLAGTKYYTSFADSVRREPVQLEQKLDTGKWRVEIFRTFDCVPDPDAMAPALLIQLKGKSILERQDLVLVSESVVINEIPEIEQGSNELYISANLATLGDFELTAADNSEAMKVVVFRGDSRITEQSFWLPGGESSIKETVRFDAPSSGSNPDDRDHEHGL